MGKVKIVKFKTEVCSEDFWSGVTRIHPVEKWVLLPSSSTEEYIHSYIRAGLRDQFGKYIHINPIEIVG